MAVGEFNQDLAMSNRSAITTIRGSWLIRLGFLLLGLLMLFMLVRTAHNTISGSRSGSSATMSSPDGWLGKIRLCVLSQTRRGADQCRPMRSF